jgi:hypothetical protein
MKQDIKIQFRAMKENMNKQNIKMNNMIMQLENSVFVVKNSRIRRLHESIHFIKVLVVDSDLRQFE